MCGAAGIIARHNKVDMHETLARMARALASRGPDGQGYVMRESGSWDIGLAHTPLAILDLSQGGCQPMAGSQKPCWISYNGEVYNLGLSRNSRDWAQSGVR